MAGQRPGLLLFDSPDFRFPARGRGQAPGGNPKRREIVQALPTAKKTGIPGMEKAKSCE